MNYIAKTLPNNATLYIGSSGTRYILMFNRFLMRSMLWLEGSIIARSVNRADLINLIETIERERAKIAQ